MINVIDPSKPYAAKVNAELAIAQRLSFPATYDEFLKQKDGDPLFSTIIPGTTIPWNKSTETQGLIWEYYQESGTMPDDLQAELDANKGPDVYWNWSYADWGMVSGEPSKLNEKLVIDPKTGNMFVAIVVP